MYVNIPVFLETHKERLSLRLTQSSQGKSLAIVIAVGCSSV